MNDTGLRIKEVRTLKNLTQEEFARQLGIKQNTVAVYESGSRNISETIIRAVCREFGVRPVWLTTGEGDMFNSDEGDLSKIIDGLMAGENETAKAVFKALAALGGDEWSVFRKFILAAAHEIERP